MGRWLALGIVVLSAAMSAGSAASAPSGAFFLMSCKFSHAAPNDPIVLPGLPGRSHDHLFVGNVSTNAYSTPTSLAGHRTTCSDPGDLSSYWAPTLYVAGTLVKPLDATIYYRRLTSAPVHPFPRGLEMVAGNSHAVTPQSPNVTEWYCGVLKSAFYGQMRRTISGIPGCAAPTNLELQVNFPDCSNGKPTSPDHRSHMAYSVNGRCPASHPIPVPAISLILRYPPVTNPNVFLSSGGVFSGHADFMDGWKPTDLNALVQSCLNRYVGCGPEATGALDTR
jgi:hypothetical protein